MIPLYIVMLKKFVLRGLYFFLITIVLGVPILSLWILYIFLTAVIILITGTLKEGFQRALICLLASILLLGLKSVIPAAHIEEGHNLFLTMNKEGELLAQNLPHPVFQFMKKHSPFMQLIIH